MEKNKTILICCVNYDSYASLKKYVNSLKISFKKCSSKNLNLHILIADNSEDKEDLFFKEEKGLTLSVYKSKENLGYLGGVESALRQFYIKIYEYDYFIISNVDLKVTEDFFPNLIKLKISSKAGWVAPSIFSLHEKKDRNPKIIQRPTPTKIFLLKTLFRFPLLYHLHSIFTYKLKTRKKKKNIYAGHGSFMIFSKYFTKGIKHIDYRPFLFGEEIFFAEKCINLKLDVIYEDTLQIIDTDHASTSKLKSKLFFKYNFEALNFLDKEFF